MVVLEKNIKDNIYNYKNIKKYGNEKYNNFKDICDMLDLEEKRFLNGEGKNYSTLEMLNRIKNRKNTFLTSI